MSQTPFFKTHCPSCGAPVEAYSATAVTLVCTYCNSMLVREDDRIVDSGRDSALLEDFSPLQIGTAGKFALRDFLVVGRLQVHYERGVWNEWYVMFQDGGEGWLSEAGDLYVMTIAERLPGEAPDFDHIRAGFSTLTYHGKTFTASDVRDVTLNEAAAQGELPFRVSGEIRKRVADWRCEQAFLTLDYAGDQPEWFVGRMVTLETLQLTRTRTDEQIRASAGRLKGTPQSEQCPHCGASVHWVSGLATHILCSSCGSKLEAGTDKVKLIQANQLRREQEKLFWLPLGKQGRLNNRDYYVMGAVRYSETDAQDTFDYLFQNRNRTLVPESWWVEYLLYHPQAGFCWLVQTAAGEWSLSETLNEWPRLNRNNQPLGYRKLYDYGGRVELAAGAFYWHVRQGDVNHYTDYSQGEHKLCAELSAHELAWSRSTPIRYEVIQQAFGLQTDGVPQYRTQMKADGVSRPLRMLMTAVLVIMNIPAWLSMTTDQLVDESMIPTFIAIGLIWFLGRDRRD